MARKHTEVFYGKRYTHYHDILDFDTKREAETSAKNLRGKGFNVKIVRRSKPTGHHYYAIYFRKKS